MLRRGLGRVLLARRQRAIAAASGGGAGQQQYAPAAAASLALLQQARGFRHHEGGWWEVSARVRFGWFGAWRRHGDGTGRVLDGQSMYVGCIHVKSTGQATR